MPTRVLIVDDDAVIRGLLLRIIEEHSDWIVCGEAVNGFDAIGEVQKLTPDVVVMDLAGQRLAVGPVSRCHREWIGGMGGVDGGGGMKEIGAGVERVGAGRVERITRIGMPRPLSSS